jgi:4-hydroxybenzoate polyprenyltransferase
MWKLLKFLTVVFAVLTFICFLAAIWSPDDEVFELSSTGALFLITGTLCSFGFLND